MDWLTLTAVSKLLGVHTSTVRLWSDKGILPVHRTSGGHRRYRRDEIELWIKTTREQPIMEPLNAIHSALGQMRLQITDGHLEAEGWYQKLDEAARIQYRQTGMSLVRSLMNYLSDEENDMTTEAYAMGYEYASRARRYGLSAVDATRAFLFFRNTLLEALVNAYDQSRVPPGTAWGRMLHKIHGFTDQILINLLETYQLFQETKGL